ncbi:hypothetical protein L596_000494 [Steinernema carpocapsae]|uniref:Uncharacterized protein n=1 Tax=Steinernema carpocapsae TaxID=34508 RepID=A0A4U8UIZ9_STECR|nr:hypothetical protein L596_000494 [Steinernema carpocapsae]
MVILLVYSKNLTIFLSVLEPHGPCNFFEVVYYNPNKFPVRFGAFLRKPQQMWKPERRKAVHFLPEVTIVLPLGLICLIYEEMVLGCF